VIRDDLEGERIDPENVGLGLAEKILAMGADEILARAYGG
jgi:hypothetical protein